MFDIEDKLDNDLNFFKINMNAKQKLTFYIDELSEKEDVEFCITFYNYDSEKIVAENTLQHTTTLITATIQKEYITHKKIFGISYYTKKEINTRVYAEIKHVNNNAVDLRVFGKVALTKLKRIIKKWSNDEEINVNYNVETTIDNYKISEFYYKYRWQSNFKELKKDK